MTGLVWDEGKLRNATEAAGIALTEPGKLASVAYGLLPKDVFISVEQKAPAGMSGEDWHRVLGLAQVMRKVAPDAGLPEIEDALRSVFAKPRERTCR